jgi:aminopeptidase
MYIPKIDDFEPFSLHRLLSTCFGVSERKLRPCILVDLDDPSDVVNFKFYQLQGYSVQKHAVDSFYKPLNNGLVDELNYEHCSFFAYEKTGGSNLDPKDQLISINGESISFENDICPNYDLIFAISDFSLTAPLTAMAKRHGFRGATLHGVNDIILNSGLSVDYNKISRQSELYRKTLDRADSFELQFKCANRNFELKIDCNRQVAQKSHGLCPIGSPDVANLPAGEVYFVPTNSSGSFPFRYPDGTLAEMVVEDGAISKALLIDGNPELVNLRNAQLTDDPATGIIGELGFGTQILPFSGKDIQDEKILGTCHVATGRSDHLGGNLTPDLFNSRQNASHDDILYAPPKTPEISVSQVIMNKNSESFKILENFNPSEFLLENLSSEYPVDLLSEFSVA